MTSTWEQYGKEIRVVPFPRASPIPNKRQTQDCCKALSIRWCDSVLKHGMQRVVVVTMMMAMAMAIMSVF